MNRHIDELASIDLSLDFDLNLTWRMYKSWIWRSTEYSKMHVIKLLKTLKQKEEPRSKRSTLARKKKKRRKEEKRIGKFRQLATPEIDHSMKSIVDRAVLGVYHIRSDRLAYRFMTARFRAAPEKQVDT